MEDAPEYTVGDKKTLDPHISNDIPPNKPDADRIIMLAQDNIKGIYEDRLLDIIIQMTTTDQERICAALSGKKGFSRQAFFRAIKDRKKRLGMLRVVTPNSQVESPRLPDLLPGCPLDAPIPASWQINQDGIFEAITKIGDSGFPNTTMEKRFPVPVVLSAVLTPLDSQEENCNYEVAWAIGSSWRRVAMDAAAVFDRARLPSAANFGLPVDSENSKGLLRWLAALRDTREIPSRKVVTRCGWHGQAYVLGEQVFGSDNTTWTPNTKGTEREMVAAMGTKGDPDRQKEFLINTCKKWPLAGFLIGVSAAAPLLRLLREHGRLDVDGFTLELVSDQAGVGKSTGIEVAASIWGQPSRLVRTCDRTGVAWEVLRHVCSDLPIFLEEVQLAKPEDREKIVYSQAQGMGRERGSRSGGMRTTRRFYNTQILASEQSLKISGAREGVEARVLSLPPVFGKRTSEHAVEVQTIRKLCGANYGYAGQTYIKHLVDTIGDPEDILNQFDRYEAMLQKKIPAEAPEEFRSMAIRMASRVASCGLGLWLLLTALDVDAVEIPTRAMVAAWNEVLLEVDAVPVWKKALSVIQSWAAENRNRIKGLELMGMYGPKSPGASYIGKQIQMRDGSRCICFYQNPLNDLFNKYMGQDSKGILKAFKREGLLMMDKLGNTTRNIGGGRAVCFSYDTVFPSDEIDEDT